MGKSIKLMLWRFLALFSRRPVTIWKDAQPFEELALTDEYTSHLTVAPKEFDCSVMVFDSEELKEFMVPVIPYAESGMVLEGKMELNGIVYGPFDAWKLPSKGSRHAKFLERTKLIITFMPKVEGDMVGIS